jgi:hypothetical protein
MAETIRREVRLEGMTAKITSVASTRTTLRIKTNVRAGEPTILSGNHGLRVKTNVRAGGVKNNHGLRVRSLDVA